MKTMSLSNKNKKSESSLQKRDLNKTKRVNSLGRNVHLIKSTVIEQAKTTRASAYDKDSFSPKIDANNNNKLINTTNTTNNRANKNTITNSSKLRTNSTTKSQDLRSKLTAIPTLTNPQQITHLDYSNNKITTVPKTIHLIYPNLSILSLASNELTSIQPLCLILPLKEIHLQFNLISFIPNSIKNLTKLQLLNLSSNKLWYVSQLVGVKQLLKVRHEVIGERCQVNLQGNSVVITNRSAVQKLLHVAINNKNKAYCDCDSEQKQNINPNAKSEYLHHGNKQQFKQNITSTVSKHNKSKSFSQSLLDMSAIIAQIPTISTTNNNNNQSLLTKQQPSVSLLNQLSSIHKQQQQRSVNYQKKLPCNNNNDLSIRQIINQQLAQKSLHNSHQDQLIGINTLMSVTQQQQHPQPSPPHQTTKHTYQQLFHSISSFTLQITTPAHQYSTLLIDIQKKLILTQKLTGIPQSLKPQFSQINQSLLFHITLTLKVLQKLEKFSQLFQFDQFSLECQKLIKFCNLLSVGSGLSIEEFYSLVVGFYLNQTQDAQLRWYEVWGNQYQRLRKVFEDVRNLLLNYLNMWKKVKRLTQMGAIIQPLFNNYSKDSTKHNPFAKSPPSLKKQHPPIKQQKNSLIILPSSQKKSSSRQSLNKLLFSQTKQPKLLNYLGSQNKQSLLLSGSKSNNNTVVIKSPSTRNNLKKQQQCTSLLKREKQNRVAQSEKCLQCPLKEQEIINLQEQLSQQQQKNGLLEQQIITLKQIISQQSVFKNQYQSILQTQNQIIKQLYQIKPSTYQHLLLQQALAVQQLIQQKTNSIDKFNYYTHQINSKPYNNQFIVQQQHNHIKFKSQLLYKQKIFNQPYSRELNEKYLLSNLSDEGRNYFVCQQDRDSGELNGLLLTEESKRSCQNQNKSVERTYFKTNGTVAVSHCYKQQIMKNSKENGNRLSFSNKNRPFTIDSKLNPSATSQHNQNSTLTRASFPSRPSPNPILTSSSQQKNQIFQQIVVNEFSNQSKELNQCQQLLDAGKIQSSTNDFTLQQMRHTSLNMHKNHSQKLPKNNHQQHLQSHNKSQQLTNKNLLKDELINSNQYYCKNQINSNSYHQKLKTHQSINCNEQKLSIAPNLSKCKIQKLKNPLLNNKTVPNLHLLRDKVFSSEGYHNETCDIFETQNYQKYVKYHLRNNIKQLLDQKYHPCHGYDHIVRNTIISRGGISQSGKNSMNKKIDISPKQKRIHHSIKSQYNSKSCQKLPNQGKYIQKPSLQQGK